MGSKDLVNYLASKGVKPKSSGSYFAIPIPKGSAGCDELTSISASLDVLERLVSGDSKGEYVKVHEELWRGSRYHDCVEDDVKFFDGNAEIKYDREKGKFLVSVSGNSYFA